MAGCGTGVSYEDRTQPAYSLSDGTVDLSGDEIERVQDVAIDATLTVGFSRSVDLATATTSSVYIATVATSVAASAESGPLTSSLCSVSRKINFSLDFVDSQIVFTPSADLTCGTVYAICLTSDLLILDDLELEPWALVFETEDC